MSKYETLSKLNALNYENFEMAFGQVINEAMDEMDNLYEDIGGSLIYLIEKNKDNDIALSLIDQTVTAITGYGIETLSNRLKGKIQEDLQEELTNGSLDAMISSAKEQTDKSRGKSQQRENNEKVK